MSNFTFTSINIPQPIGSDVYVAADGIDAAGEVVGSYGYTDGDDDSYFHGFTATGSVGITFDPPGSSNTNGIGITESGEIFGDYVDWYNRQHGFVDINGVFQQIDVFLASSTTVDGVTNAGTIFGTYVDEFGFGINGFIDNNGSFSLVDVPGAYTTSISGVNAAGEIVGVYMDASYQAHGFADVNGSFATIDPVGSISTSLVGVSADGTVIAGNYEDSSSNNNGFVDDNGVITTIEIPGATSTGVAAINNAGEVVGYYVDGLGNVHGFIDKSGVITTLDVPGATETDIYGVSDTGIITGAFNDSSYVQHGFVAAPEVGSITVSGTTSDALQGSSPVTLLTGATVTDPGQANLTSVTIKIANGGNAAAGDELAVNGQQSGTVDGGAISVSWNAASDTLTLAGNAAPGTYQALLGQVSYQDAGTDSSTGSHPERTVTWTANDGSTSFGTTSQIAIERAPAVTTSNVTLLQGQGPVAASSLFSASDPDGDAIAKYAFWDTGAGGGHFVLNGTALGANQSITVTAAQLAQLTYQAGTGGDTIWVNANDGTRWDNGGPGLTVRVDVPPVVTTSNVTLGPGPGLVAASSLFAASVPAGETITEYAFWNTGAGGGHFVLNGTALGANQSIVVTAAQLAQLSYQAGTGADTLWVDAYDGAQWNSGSQGFTVSPWVDVAPTVTTSNVTLSKGQSLVAASSLFSASVPAGETITEYAFWDTGTGGGHFVLNGTALGTNQSIAVTATQLTQLSYQAGTGADTLWVQAYDGTQWNTGGQGFTVSPWVDTPPTVTVSNLLTVSGQSLTASSLFGATDPDGDTITEYAFSNTGTGGGHFALNGVTQAANQEIDVTAAQLAQLSYQSGSGPDTLMVKAYDGTQWSAWSSGFTVSSENPAVIGAGATLDLNTYSGAVTYLASTGTLELASSSGFTGSVSGLTGQDGIDLLDMNFASVQQPSFAGTSAGGTLTVTDGTHTAAIALLGNYLSSGWDVSSDGKGGTLVVDPPLDGSSASPGENSELQGNLARSAALLTNYMASAFPPSGSSSGQAVDSSATAFGQSPLLAQPPASQSPHA